MLRESAQARKWVTEVVTKIKRGHSLTGKGLCTGGENTKRKWKKFMVWVGRVVLTEKCHG